jgi:hypothetical protein
MAYPEPILPLKGKKAIMFREKWEQFKVSKEERKRLAGISEKVRRKMADKK